MTPIDARMAALAAAGRIGRACEARGLGPIAIQAAAAAPERIIIREGGREVTRAELLDAALCLGGGLRARGIKRGAAIAFQLPNWWEACAINLCAALFGYRLVPLLTIYRAAELTHILAACGVEAIFVPESFRGKDFPAQIAALPAPPAHVFRLRAARAEDDDFAALLRAEPAAPVPADPSDARLVIFTSGSTGLPKGVLHSHATMEALIRDTAAFWGITYEDNLYVPSPIAHVGGAIYAFDFPWVTGCIATLEEAWDAARAVARIDGEGITFMAGATPFLSGLLEAANMAGTTLPSLRRFICGGASVSPDLVRAALKAFPGATVSRAYGSSEVPLICPGVRSRAEAEARADTDGECTAELRLLTPEGIEAAPGQPGEIAVRAPQMLLGYLSAEDEAGAFDRAGYFRTGDIGTPGPGAFLTITGRLKDIIIRKGENISPLEIENALLTHPGLSHAAVVGCPDEARGEMVVAYVTRAPGAGFDLDAMRAHLDAAGLAKQKFPERLEILDQMPMNAVGKIKKDVLRRMAQAKEPGGET